MSTNQSSQNSNSGKKKVSRYETGHVKNVANFEDMMAFCSSYGARYNPANEVLTLPKLKSKHEDGKNVLAELTTLRTKFDVSVDLRRIEFDDVKSLGMRAVNSFAVSGVDKLMVDSAKHYLRKLQGGAKKKAVAFSIDNNAEGISEAKEVRQISTSQQSYDRQIDNLSSIVEVLSQSGTYNPNEPDLTLTALNQKIEKLKEVNSLVINDYTAYYGGLNKRNNVLYNPLTGLVNTALSVKMYIKSIFGVTSPEYKQVNSIEFRNR